MLMELFSLSIKPFRGAVERIRRPPSRQVEEPTGQLHSTSSNNQSAGPSSDMAQKHINDHGHDSEDNSRGPKNDQHEGHLQSTFTIITRSARHGREDQSDSRSQQAVRPVPGGERKSLEDRYRRLIEMRRRTMAKLREVQDRCKSQQQEIDLLKENLRGTSEILDVRNQELKVAKTFLTKEDPCSLSDVVQAVRDLNSEVMQTAARLADNLALKRVRNYPIGPIPDGPYKSIFVTLASQQGPGDEVDAGSLDLALQGFLIVWVYWIANAWGFCQPSSWFHGLYSKVCENENPAVASNWRALTRRTLFNIDSNQGDLPCQVVNGAIEGLASGLSYCGVGETFDNARGIYEHAAEKFGSLFAAARKLNKMIGENIVSDDLMVAIIDGGYFFDGENMEDAYARGGAKPGQRVVVCTTGLGLCESKSRGKEMLLKPKVVLRDL